MTPLQNPNVTTLLAPLRTDADQRVERRRQTYVDMARHSFFAKGFAGTSMSEIALRVGGSKTTLWTYFPSKEALFAAVVDDIVEQYGEALAIDFLPDESIDSELQKFGAALLNTVLSDPVMALHRLVVGEAARFPQLAEMFYTRGAQRGQHKLAKFIESAMGRGMLNQGDATLAARQFAALCLSGSFQLALLGIAERPSPTVIASEVREAVKLAMRAWKVQL